MNEQSAAAHIITFTDLVYAALLAYGLALFDSRANHRDWWAVGYLVAAAVWLFYDWYANHYFAIEQRLGARNLPLDGAALLLYTGLLYASARKSSWIFLFLALRAARGIVYNEMALSHGKGPRDPNRLRSYNYSSGFMAVTYTPLFVLGLVDKLFSAGVILAVAVALWLIAYAMALVAEARYDKRTVKLAAQVRSAERVGASARRLADAVSFMFAAVLFVASMRRGRPERRTGD